MRSTCLYYVRVLKRCAKSSDYAFCEIMTDSYKHVRTYTAAVKSVNEGKQYVVVLNN